MIRKPSAPPEIVILSAAFLFIFMGAGAQQQFLAPYFTEVMDWSPVHRGLVPAAIYLSMTVWRMPAVWVVSRVGERTAMLLGGLAYILFPLAVYYVSSWPFLILSAAAWGAGATLMWVTSSIRVIDAANVRNYGKTSGFFIGAVHSGILIGYILLSRIADVYSLHSVFIVASALTVVGWIIMLTLPTKNTHRTAPSFSMVRQITRLPNWGIVAALLGLAALGYGLMLVPLGEALVETLGVSSLALAAIYPFGRLVISLSGGWLSDIIGRRLVIAVGFFLAGTGLAITAYSFGSGWAMAVGIFSVGLLGGIAPAMGLAFVGDVATSDTRLMVHASLFAFNDFGVAVAIIGGQFLRDSIGGFAPTFAVFSALLIACGIWAYASFRPVSAVERGD